MVIPADTSIWIDHLRKEDLWFAELLGQRRIVVHPFILGELALGSVPHLDAIIRDFRDLPQSPVVPVEEVLQLIKTRNLSGSGIGYVDAHLLASALQVAGTKLLTSDRRLHAAASRLMIAIGR